MHHRVNHHRSLLPVLLSSQRVNHQDSQLTFRHCARRLNRVLNLLVSLVINLPCNLLVDLRTYLQDGLLARRVHCQQFNRSRCHLLVHLEFLAASRRGNHLLSPRESHHRNLHRNRQ